MKNYEMFTDEGNEVIQNIVDVARQSDLSWKQVQALLEHTYQHGKITGQHTECLDTDVREAVFCELGFHKKNVNFFL
jgi:hypothetical protein